MTEKGSGEINPVKAHKFLSDPRRPDERIFREDSIKGYEMEELAGVRFACVFSWTAPGVKYEEKHCYKATVCAGIANEGMIYILKTWMHKENVRRMVNGMYSIYAYTACNPNWMFYGENGGQALPGEVPDMKAGREGCHIPCRAETNSIRKDTRIGGTLSAPGENGIIRFYKAGPDQKELPDDLLTMRFKISQTKLKAGTNDLRPLQ